MHTLIAFVLLVGAAMAGPTNLARKLNARIVGGSSTTVDQYPYITNMQFNSWANYWTQYCGGSLITSRTILSAAHCYEDRVPSEWRVRVGTSFSSFGGVIHEVEAFILHERYGIPTNANNDVAIVRLKTPVQFNANVAAARIAGPNYILPDNTVITTIGWGTMSNWESAEQLQHVDINVINQELCAERYAYLKSIPGFGSWPDVTDTMICAGILDVGGKDACQGDSGGPVVHQKDIVIGVVSWGFGCGDYFYPGVNARVSALADWILENGSA